MLPPAVQKQVDEAARLAAEHRQGGSDQPNTVLPNTDPSAGVVEKLKSDLTAAQAEVTRLTQANSVLRGKYDAEVPRQAEEIRALKGKIEDLERKVERAGIQAGEITSLTPEERDMAGPMTGVASKIAREIASEAIAEATKPLKDEIGLLRRQSEENFLATLDAGLPQGWS